MPVFNLELKFDDSGSLQAVKQLNGISDAASSATNSLKRTGDKAEDVGKSISDAMKKAAVRVLGLVSAWKALNVAQRTFTLGSSYNERIEKAQLGIASVVAATNELTDAQGRILSGQEKFNAAQELSVKMAKALDVASMQSPAEYNDLLSTFQRMLAPATQLGVKWQDTLNMTIRMSNVLSSLGLDMQSLGNEMQAIMTGTNLSRSQVASRLGITKAEIESWGKGEQLLANMQKRLEAFEYSGKAVEQTMEAVRAYFEDVIQNVAGDAVSGLWDQVKTGMQEVADAFYEIDEKSKEFKLTDDMEGLVGAINEIATAIGESFVGAIRSGIDALKRLGASINEMGISQFLGEVKTYSGVALAGLTALIVARKAASAQWATEVAGTKDGIAAIYKHTAAAIRNTQARHNDAVAAKEQAQAEVNLIRARLQATQALMQNLSGEHTRAAFRRQEIALANELAVAEARLAQTQTLANKTSVAMTGLMKAGSGLLSLFGGPFGAALTAVGVGMGVLYTSQSDAEKAANLHADALRSWSKAAENAKAAGKALTDQLDELGEAQKARAREDAEEAVRLTRRSLASTANFQARAGLGGMEWDANDYALADEKEQKLYDITTNLDRLNDSTLKNKTSLKEYRDALEAAYIELSNMGEGQSRLAKYIRSVSDSIESGVKSEALLAGSTEELGDSVEATGVKISESAKKTNELIEALDLLKAASDTEVKSEKEAIEWLEKRFQATEAGKTSLEANAKAKDENAIKTLELGLAELELAANAASAKASMDAATEADIKNAEALNNQANALRETIKKYKKAQPQFGEKPIKTGGVGRSKSGGSSSIDNAPEKWDELNQRLAVLQGNATSASTSLNKTLKEIEETGKAAKKTAGEIESLKQAFIEATDTKAMRELNKELLQLEGNTRAVREIEAQEKTDQFRAKLSEVRSLSSDEKEILLGRYQKAVASSVDKENIETRLNFYKELAQLSGDYSLSIEYQNKLIDEQGKEWLAAGISVDDVKKRVELMKAEIARDPFSGMIKGLSNYSDEATNLADQMSNAVGNAFQGMEDAFIKFAQTGKLSFSDMANSIISDLMRIAVRSMITGPIANAVGGLFGSFFGGGSSGIQSAIPSHGGFSQSNAVISHYNLPSAKGNVFAGGNISSFSNKVVASPTFFDFDRHLATFATGGGIMGEKGPEAIMPLGRTPGGDLGVRIIHDDIGVNSDNYAKIIAELNAQLIEARLGSGGAMPVVNINIENNSNAQVQAGQMKSDGNGGFSLDIIVSQVEQAMVGRAKQGKSQLMQYQEKTYGMNRAGVIARGRGRN